MPHNLRIIDYALGHTGSIHDSNAYRDTHIYHEPAVFLDPGAWIWADSAYLALPHCVTPFKKPPRGVLSRSQRHFNHNLSCIRIQSEHVIGLLKGHFQSLKEIRIHINSQR